MSTERDSPDDVRARLEALVEPDIAGEVADGVGSLLGLAGANARVEDARVALRHLFGAVAARRPLVVAFDDIHWAEPPLLDLIDDLADWLPDAPVVLLCMARPELLDERPGWSGGKLNATTLLLEPLSEADGETLVRELLGADLPEPVAGRIVTAAEGNPLFVEELIGMLLDDGHLRRVGGGVEVAGAVERVELPPTIQALLAARLDRLSNAERGVVERASIEGQVFHLGALAALGAARDEILPTVRTLARKQLFRSDQAALPGQDAYRFRHILIREAAYERVAKEVRARWHEAFADWLEALAGERIERIRGAARAPSRRGGPLPARDRRHRRGDHGAGTAGGKPLPARRRPRRRTGGLHGRRGPAPPGRRAPAGRGSRAADRGRRLRGLAAHGRPHGRGRRAVESRQCGRRGERRPGLAARLRLPWADGRDLRERGRRRRR